MQPYRIYPLTLTGKLKPPVVHECRDDEDAIALAQSLPPQPEERGYEVWQLGRKVARVLPEGKVDEG